MTRLVAALLVACAAVACGTGPGGAPADGDRADLLVADGAVPPVAPDTRQDEVAAAFTRWLSGHVDATGFVRDQESIVGGRHVPTTTANLYPMALTATVAARTGDPALARRVLDRIRAVYDATFATGPGGLYSGYDAATGAPDTGSDRYVSNNAFVLLALAHYAAAQPDDRERYRAMADGLAGWIVHLQDVPGGTLHHGDGGVYAGYAGSTSATPDALLTVKITEANIAVDAALAAHAAFFGGPYRPRADQVEAFLRSAGGQDPASGLRDAAAGRFFAGKADTPAGPPSWDDTHYLDNVLWAALAVRGDEALTQVLGGLPAVHAELAVRGVHPDVDPAGAPIAGWRDTRTKERVFTPGYAYLALLAARLDRAGGTCAPDPRRATARAVNLASYTRLLIPSAVAGGAGAPIVANDPEYPGASTSPSAEAVLWYLLAARGVNPFDPAVPAGSC